MQAGVIFFWSFVTLTSVSIIWVSHLNNREIERTIRAAFEQDTPLDVETIRMLKHGSIQRKSVNMTISGVILLSVAVALALFGLILAPEEPETLLPLLAIAAFIAIPALTISGCGFFLRHRAMQNSRHE